MLGHRKFVVVMTALFFGFLVALAAPEAMAAYAGLTSIVVGAYCGAHAVADSKFGKQEAK